MFSLFAEHIKREAGLDKDDRGFRTSGRNINNLWYVGDATLSGKSGKAEGPIRRDKEQIKWRDGTLAEPKKTKAMATGKTTNFTTDGEDVEMVDSFCLLGSIINNR